MDRPPSREDLYRHVVIQLFSLVRCVESPGDDGQMPVAAGHELARTIAKVTDAESSLMLQVRAGILFCNGVKLRLDVRAMAAAEMLGHKFHMARLAGLLLEHGVGQEVLTRVAEVLARPGSEDPEELTGVHWIKLWDGLEGGESAGRGRDTYLKTIFVMKRLMDALGTLDGIDLRVQREIVASLVEGLLSSSGNMAGLTALHAEPGGRFQTAVRRAVHGVWFGRSLGLSEEHLRRVGLAALFHGSSLAPMSADDNTSIIEAIVALVGCWEDLADQSPKLTLPDRLLRLRAHCGEAPVSRELLRDFEAAITRRADEPCGPGLPQPWVRR